MATSGICSIIDILMDAKFQVLEVLPNEKIDNIKDAMMLHHKVTRNNFIEPFPEDVLNELYKLTRRMINLYHQKDAWGL